MDSGFGDEQDLNREGEKDAQLREHLAAFGEDATQRASRPEWFWSAQSATIRERVAGEGKAHSLRWALGSALALVALASFLLMVAPGVPNTAAPTETSKSQSKVDDDALMRDVMNATSGTGPEALAPATLLADEVDRGLKTVVKAKGETR